MNFKMLWVGRSKNDKTGDIPQGYVGADREQTEKSCEGCPLRKGGCYHWQGAIRAQSSMQRAHAKNPDGDRYSLSRAIAESRRTARYARGAVGGDPWVFDRETVEGWISDLNDQGLRGLLLYTHFAADKGAHLKGLAMASVHARLWLRSSRHQTASGQPLRMCRCGTVKSSPRPTVTPGLSVLPSIKR